MMALKTETAGTEDDVSKTRIPNAVCVLCYIQTRQNTRHAATRQNTRHAATRQNTRHAATRHKNK
jgi:hypothetical protein